MHEFEEMLRERTEWGREEERQVSK